MLALEKEIRRFEYVSGTQRLIPDQCSSCNHRVNRVNGEDGDFCLIHASIVEKEDHFLHVYRANTIDSDHPYKQRRDPCEKVGHQPQQVNYAQTWGGRFWKEKNQQNKGEEPSMLKEQRERLPVFQANIQKIIDADGMAKVTELLKVTAPTVKKWLQGKDNGGTEPPSSDYERHEKAVNEYVAKMASTEPASEPEPEVDPHDPLEKTQLMNQIQVIRLSCETYLKMPLSEEDRITVDMIREICIATMDMATTNEILQMQLEIVQGQYDLFQENFNQMKEEKADMPLLPSETAIDITAEVVEEEAVSSPAGDGKTIRLSLTLIDPNPYQPRKTFDEASIEELAQSIKETGLLQPPVIRQVGDRYQLVAGERRTRAMRSLGWEEGTFLLIEISDMQLAASALVENYQREDVSALETARAAERLINELGMKQSEVAKKLGVTQAKVSQMLAVLKLCDPLMEQLVQGNLSSSVARIIGTLPKDIQLKMDVEEVLEMTVKDVQSMVNQIKFIDSLIPRTPIEEDDPLRVKFVKFMNERGIVDVFETWDNNTYMLERNEANLEMFQDKGFNVIDYRTIPIEYRNNYRDTVTFLCAAINKPYDSERLALGLKEDHEGLPDAIKTFMELYCPYEPPKAASSSISPQTKQEGSEPPTPRLTKEEREERLQAAQENSPVPVLTASKPTTKTERLLQRLQEHQGEPVHELSHRCYNCRHFKPDAQEYRDRCGARNVSINSFERYHIEGEPDLFHCDNYEPTDEQIEKEKVEGLDTELALFEMLLFSSYAEPTLKHMIPEMKGKTEQEMIEIYAKMDEKSRAYTVAALSMRVGMRESHGGRYFMYRPDGTRITVKHGLVTGSDDL